MTSRRSNAAPILVELAIVLPLLLIGLYVGGYVWLSERLDWQVDDNSPAAAAIIESSRRFYPHQWMATVFDLAARVESLLTGIHVDTAQYADDSLSVPQH